MKTKVGRLRKQAKNDEKPYRKLGRTLDRFFNDFLDVLGSIWGGFWEHFGIQKPFKFQSHFWDALL